MVNERNAATNDYAKAGWTFALPSESAPRAERNSDGKYTVIDVKPTLQSGADLHRAIRVMRPV